MSPVSFTECTISQVEFDDLENFFSFDGIAFKQLQSTTFPHRNNTVIPSYKNQPFITGSGTHHNVKTEIFDMRSMQWLAGADYPFTKLKIQKK